MSNYPETIQDSSGRYYCKIHHLETCPYCCLSFEIPNQMIAEESALHSSIGVFLSEDALYDWHRKMQVKMPQVFPPDDNLFGEHGGQHPFGTRLKAYFDDDPNKPMSCTILGSLWEKDELASMFGSGPCADGREPYYVIKINGELSKIALTDAHEEGEGGWKVDTEVGEDEEINVGRNNSGQPNRNFFRTDSDDEEDEEVECNDVCDEEEDDEDSDGPPPPLGQWHDDGISSETDDDSDGSPPPLEQWTDAGNTKGKSVLELKDMALEKQNGCILQARNNVTQWDDSRHGDFLKQFLECCFTIKERDFIMRDSQSRNSNENEEYNIKLISEKIKSFPMKPTKSAQGSSNVNFDARIILANMIVHHMVDNLGGVILKNQRGTKFQAIEFNNNFVSNEYHIPFVEISYATDPEGIDNPKDFLRGETFEILELPNDLATVIESHILNFVSNDSLNDVGSGLLFHRGYLAPIGIDPLETGEDVVQSTSYATVPSVKFGVELELSCASGNFQKRTARNLSNHAGVDVLVGYSDSKGKGSGEELFTNQKGNSKGKDGKVSSNNHKWKLVFDRSIQANKTNPLSAKFELVSPILQGEDGLDTLAHTLSVMKDVACVRVNKTMGLHVHIEVKKENYSLQNIISLCQQFLLYEYVIDSFLPSHRRTGSRESCQYFQSNTLSMLSKTDNVQLALSSCKTYHEVYDLMNSGPRPRYHKLNFQNLKTGRQPTVEFRQYPATTDVDEVVAWVRFCILFVLNSSKKLPLVSVSGGQFGGEKDATIESLFDDIIRCTELKRFFLKKKGSFEKA